MERYVPHKTPNKVFENLSEYIENKSFFEIGSGWGHSLAFIGNFHPPPKKNRGT